MKAARDGGAKIRTLSFKRRIFLTRRARKLALRQIRPRVKSRRKQLLQSLKPPHWIAPKVFGLVDPESRGALLRKIEVLRKEFVRAKILATGLHLDFSGTEKLFAEGTLLFVAVLRDLITQYGAAHLSCTASENNKVCQVFEQIGLRELLGINSDIAPADDDVVHWRFAHGSSVDGSRYEDVLSEYDDRLADIQQELLFTGITEAMTNVLNHAYEGDRRRGARNGWWMFSQWKEGFLTIAFCDLGLGIPRTIQTKHPNVWGRFLLLGKQRDAYAIEYSVQDSISRTKARNRGKGLGQIVSLATTIPGAEVSVFSNKGLYIKSISKSKKRDYRDSILGTLIFWKIPLIDKEQS